MTQDAQQEGELLRSVLNDLLSESPTYDYDHIPLNGVSHWIKRLIGVRQHGGIEALQHTIEHDKKEDEVLRELLDPPRPKPQKTKKWKEPPVTPPLPSEAFQPPVNITEVSPTLALYLDYSERRSPEGHEDMYVACAIWAHSTIAARRIYIPLATPVYTPVAIALVARSSLFVKSVTAYAAVTALRESGLGWLLGDDETTPQKLLEDMSGAVPTNYGELTDEQKESVRMRLSMPGQVGWYYDEFNQLINAMLRQNSSMADFAGLLRRLDFCPDPYAYSTRSHGRAFIEKPYLSLMGSTTPANLRKVACRGAEFWGDGFWARFGFICPPPDSWITQTMELEEAHVPNELIQAWQDWNVRLGVPSCQIREKTDKNGNGIGRFYRLPGDTPLIGHPVSMDQDAYDAYVTYRVTLRAMTSETSLQDLDGSYTRLSTMALRIAALIASLDHLGHLTLECWQLGQQIAEMFRKHLHELYRQVNLPPEEETTSEDALLAYLEGLQDPVTARHIKQFGPGAIQRMSTEAIRELLRSLEHDGLVKIERTNEGNKKISYSYVQQSKEDEE